MCEYFRECLRLFLRACVCVCVRALACVCVIARVCVCVCERARSRPRALLYAHACAPFFLLVSLCLRFELHPPSAGPHKLTPNPQCQLDAKQRGDKTSNRKLPPSLSMGTVLGHFSPSWPTKQFTVRENFYNSDNVGNKKK